MPALINADSLPQGYQEAGRVLHQVAESIAQAYGASTVLSVLLSTFLQIAVDTGRTDTAKRLLPFALSNLDALVAIREAEQSAPDGSGGQG